MPRPVTSPEETPFSLPGGAFGDLRRDGFRLTRWEHVGAGRKWLDASALVVGLNVAGSCVFGRGATGEPVAAGEGFVAAPASPRPYVEVHNRGSTREALVAMEVRRGWLARWLPAGVRGLCGPAAHFLDAGSKTGGFARWTLTGSQAQLASDLLRPPVGPAAWRCWHHAKALELVALALVVPAGAEMFCERTKRLARERVQRVREILLADLENPPELSELGRLVGCSPFYLSRTFRQESGQTISAFLRRARIDRAAELLRRGEANVTESALAVGYSSLSHFSKAFAEVYGCCPCLFGRKPGRASSLG